MQHKNMKEFLLFAPDNHVLNLNTMKSELTFQYCQEHMIGNCLNRAKYYINTSSGKRFLCGTHKNSNERRGNKTFPIKESDNAK